MSEINEQEVREETEAARHQQRRAENTADREQPSHYEARKEDLTTEGELHQLRREEATASANVNSTDAPAEDHGAHVEDNTTGGDGATAPRAEPPEEFTGLRLKPASTVAGGVPAILSTMKHAWREMGALR